jgi:hypothetical protein
MFQENNIHTKIARNVLRNSHITLIDLERFNTYGKGNRFMRRLNILIAENKIDKYKLVKNHFMQDFVFLTTLLYAQK